MMTLASLLTMGRTVHLFARKIIPVLGKDFEVFGVEKRSNVNFRIYLTKYFWVDIFPSYYAAYDPNSPSPPEFQYSVVTYKEVVQRINNLADSEFSFIRDLDEVLQEIKKEFKSKLKRFWHTFRFNKRLKILFESRRHLIIFLSPSLKFLANKPGEVCTKQNP